MMGDDDTMQDEERRRARTRLRIAQALLGRALQGGPVMSPLQGIARMAGAALGGWQAHQAEGDLASPRPAAAENPVGAAGMSALPDPMELPWNNQCGDNPWERRADAFPQPGPRRRR